MRVALLIGALAAGCGAGGDGGAPDGGGDDPDAGADAPVVGDDPCPVAPAACPTLPAGYAVGDGLRAIDRCAFPLTERDTWAVRRAIVDALPAAARRVTLADVAGDLNRAATRATSVRRARPTPHPRNAGRT